MAQSVRKTYSLAQKVALVTEVDLQYRGCPVTATVTDGDAGLHGHNFQSAVAFDTCRRCGW